MAGSILLRQNRFGHWEGDTIQFVGNRKKVVTTLVERKSRMVLLIKNNSKHSNGVMEKIRGKFESLPQKMCKTITFDQGVEFADYKQLETKMKCRVYYCETHSPWQKGTNENMNGRLRRYLPNTTNIDQITQKDLDSLAHRMNLCPRKCLGYKMPQEVFIQQHKNEMLPQRKEALEQWGKLIESLITNKDNIDFSISNSSIIANLIATQQDVLTKVQSL